MQINVDYILNAYEWVYKYLYLLRCANGLLLISYISRIYIFKLRRSFYKSDSPITFRSVHSRKLSLITANC